MSAAKTARDTRGPGPALKWQDKSACLTEDPELFFPIGNGAPAQLQAEEAKQVCRGCPVRTECLAWALENGADHGVWGGLDEDERKKVLRKTARKRLLGLAA